MTIEELEKLLANDIEDYQIKKANLENRSIFLIRVINDLSENRISKRAKSYFMDNYKMEVTKYNRLEFLRIARSDIRVQTLKYELLKENLNCSLKAYNEIHFNQIITPSSIVYIEKRLIDLKAKDLIALIELIKIRNSKKAVQNGAMKRDDLFLILNIINQGYEEIIIDEINPKIDNELISFIKNLEENGIGSLETLINLKLYENEDKIYLYKSILKYYQNKIYELCSILNDKNFYFNISILAELKEDYKKHLAKYLLIRNKLNELESVKEQEEEDLEIAISEENKLYYSSLSDSPEKCYFIRDLTLIRETSYSTILELLENFKFHPELVHVKRLKNCNGCLEIKKDQIRIILKRIKDNCFSVLGVFIKKSMNDITSYKKISNRIEALINDDYSASVEEYYKEYILNNARKGSRS